MSWHKYCLGSKAALCQVLSCLYDRFSRQLQSSIAYHRPSIRPFRTGLFWTGTALVMLNPQNDFDAWLAGLVTGYQYFTIKLSVWQHLTQQPTRAKHTAGRVERQFTLSRSGLWWSATDRWRGSGKYLRKLAATHFQHTVRTGRGSPQAEFFVGLTSTAAVNF